MCSLLDWKRLQSCFPLTLFLNPSILCGRTLAPTPQTLCSFIYTFLFFHFLVRLHFNLKCGFLKKSFIINAPLVCCPFPDITLEWMQQQTLTKVMTENGQLRRDAVRIKDFLRNPHLSRYVISLLGLFATRMTSPSLNVSTTPLRQLGFLPMFTF